MSPVYLDNNATTAVAPEVLEAMLPFFRERWGNPSSMHAFGGNLGRDVERARAQVAALLGAETPSEIVFTSGGTESDNTAILSALEAYPDRRQVVTTRVEHPAVLSFAQHLERKGYEIARVGVDRDGNLDVVELRAALSSRTAIVSVMWANNETGVIFPVEEIARMAHEAGALFHTDAVQAVGKIPMNLRDSSIDMLSLSGHKLHGPKGIGALYVRRGTRFRPHVIGGHQERNRRGGTENVPGIVGLGRAAESAAASLEEERRRVAALRDRLEQGLIDRVPDAVVNGTARHRLPNTTNVSFQFIEGEAILLMLDREGICASSGSACSSGSLEPSHVLRAMGIPFTYAHGSIRLSLSRYNTDADIDHVLDVLPRVIARLREISPFSREHPVPSGPVACERGCSGPSRAT
jgi:cysteine desulfurase